MVSTRPLISKSFSPFNNPSVTVPKAPITISIIVTSMFHSFSIPSEGRGIILLLAFFQFYSMIGRDSKVHNFVNSLFLLIIIVVMPVLIDLFVCPSPTGINLSHSLGQMLGRTYTICSYGQIQISCRIPSGLSRTTSRV